MTGDANTLVLGAQLLISGALVFVLTLFHALGLLGIGKVLHLEPEALRSRSIDLYSIMTMAGLGLMIFSLHIVEILMFAAFYLGVGALQGLDHAIFVSASAYTTLGLTTWFPEKWRLIGAAEALIGFVLIGWSTAFMIGTMESLREKPRNRKAGN